MARPSRAEVICRFKSQHMYRCGVAAPGTIGSHDPSEPDGRKYRGESPPDCRTPGRRGAGSRVGNPAIGTHTRVQSTDCVSETTAGAFDASMSYGLHPSCEYAAGGPTRKKQRTPIYRLWTPFTCHRSVVEPWEERDEADVLWHPNPGNAVEQPGPAGSHPSAQQARPAPD
jgi:hypothetical protein